MNRLHLNLMLLVAIIGLLAVLMLSRKTEDTGPTLTALDIDTVTRIRIEHPDQPTIALARQDGVWQLTEPIQARADAVEVRAILNLARAQTQRTLATSEVDLSELKLDPPRYRVRFDDTLLEIGDVEPIEYRRYVRNGERIGLIADPASAALDADYADLVARELLPPDARIQRIEVPGLVLARSADGQHWQETPAQAGVSADDRQRVVDGWRQARALWNALIPAGTAPAGEPLTLTLEDGTVHALRLVAREPQLVIDDPALGIRYSLSRALEGELLRLPQAAADTPAPP